MGKMLDDRGGAGPDAVAWSPGAKSLRAVPADFKIQVGSFGLEEGAGLDRGDRGPPGPGLRLRVRLERSRHHRAGPEAARTPRRRPEGPDRGHVPVARRVARQDQGDARARPPRLARSSAGRANALEARMTRDLFETKLDDRRRRRRLEPGPPDQPGRRGRRRRRARSRRPSAGAGRRHRSNRSPSSAPSGSRTTCPRSSSSRRSPP